MHIYSLGYSYKSIYFNKFIIIDHYKWYISVEKEDTRKEVTYAKEDVAYAKEEESYEDKEGGYEDTGHANNADYDQLCSKVEELRDRKKYMDQLLSYYNVRNNFIIYNFSDLFSMGSSFIAHVQNTDCAISVHR